MENCKIYKRLSDGFRIAQEIGQPLSSLTSPDNSYIDDLATIPKETEFVYIQPIVSNLDISSKLTKNIEKLAELNNLCAAFVFPADNRTFQLLSKLPKLEAVCFRDCRKVNFEIIEGFNSLRHLVIDWAPKLVNVEFLSKFPNLETVYLKGVTKLDINSFPATLKIKGLHIAGGLWKFLVIPNYQSISRISSLWYAKLIAKPLDTSLKPLSNLINLKYLDLPNYSTMDDYAYLSTKLKGVDSNCFSPIWGRPSIYENNAFRCKKCNEARYIMIGKQSKKLCPKCNRKRHEEHVALWNKFVQENISKSSTA